MGTVQHRKEIGEMRAAIYARYSSENQRASSIDDQVRLCRQEAERRGWTIAAEWQDAAVSGAVGEDQRPGFREMMAAASRREFDVLVVDDSSRLSRDSADATVTLRMLDFLGVKFVARSDGIDTVANGKSSRLLYGIKSAMNEEFLRDLGEKTHRGQEGRVRAGYSAGGLPYGYRSEPVLDERGQVVGYKHVVYEPEAEIVRRIFRLYVGDDGGHPHSAREVALVLNRDGIAPPGARWKGKTIRQCKTWSYTAIIGHRKLAKGILNNPVYVGKRLWNRSQWLRHPVTKHYRYRVRPQEDWVACDAPELAIVPQDLWDRAHTQAASRRTSTVPPNPGNPRFRKYLLSGFVRCAECGGAYTITTPFSYRCGTFRNRGPVACSNHLAVSRRRLEQTVLQAFREKLYTGEKMRDVVDQVREIIRERGRRHAVEHRRDERDRELRKVEQEIANIADAIRKGVVTPTTKAILLDAERRRNELQAASGAAPDSGVTERVRKVLERLPELVQQHLADLETLLAAQQVDKGKAILAALDTTVTLYPCGDKLEAEIAGTLEGLFTLAIPGARGVQLAVESSSPSHCF